MLELTRYGTAKYQQKQRWLDLMLHIRTGVPADSDPAFCSTEEFRVQIRIRIQTLIKK
jgi:hypothetical protein